MTNEIKKEPTSIETFMKEVLERKNSAEMVKEVRSALFDKLYKDEHDQRVSLLTSALIRRTELQIEFKKCRKDQKTVDDEGNIVSEGFSTDAFNKRKEAKEKLDKIERAINLALDEGNFDKIKELK